MALSAGCRRQLGDPMASSLGGRRTLPEPKNSFQASSKIGR